jgi:hypothetical protein
MRPRVALTAASAILAKSSNWSAVVPSPAHSRVVCSRWLSSENSRSEPVTASRVSPVASGVRRPAPSATIGPPELSINNWASRRMTKSGSVESAPMPSLALRTVRPTTSSPTGRRSAS